jgi:anaerobic C4-dicarboxylate transporter
MTSDRNRLVETMAGEIVELLEVDPRTITDCVWDKLVVMLGGERLNVDPIIRKRYQAEYRERRKARRRAMREAAKKAAQEFAVAQSVPQSDV